MIQGRDLLAVVAILAREDGEVFQRSLISRAYYAAYLESCSLCEDHLGFVRSARGAEHREVPTLLAAIDPDLRTRLRLLRQLRNAADYDIELSAQTIAHSAQQSRLYATSILTALDRHRATFEATAQQHDSPEPPPSKDQDG